MHILTQTISALFLILLLTACGGGSSSGGGNVTVYQGLYVSAQYSGTVTVTLDGDFNNRVSLTGHPCTVGTGNTGIARGSDINVVGGDTIEGFGSILAIVPINGGLGSLYVDRVGNCSSFDVDVNYQRI